MAEDNQRFEGVERRMAALELEISVLRQTLVGITQASQTQPQATTQSQIPIPQTPPARPPSPAPPAYISPESARSGDKSGFKADGFVKQFGSSEFWINKAGIGLLLLGVIFLFKYSIDQGWITPAIRIVFGLALGLGLALAGARMYSKKRHQSLVALGGAVATFYICGFAMYQMYALTPYYVAFSLMGLASAAAFAFSVKQDEPALSFVAALGAFVAPFLLYTDQSNVPGLMLYTSLVIVTSCGVYMARGWVSLLTLSAVCGWAIMLLTVDSPLEGEYEKLAAQAGITLSWLAFWGSPLTRLTILAREKLPKWLTNLDTSSAALARQARSSLPGHAHTMTVTSPVIALALSMEIWSLPDWNWSLISLVVAGLYFAVWMGMRGKEMLRHIATTQMIAGFLMITAGAIALLDDTTTPAFIAAQALALLLASSRLLGKSAQSVKKWALVYLVVSLAWIGLELVYGTLFDNTNKSAVAPETLVTLWIVGVTFAFSYFSETKEERLGLSSVGAFALTLICLDVQTSNGLFLAVTLTGIALLLGAQKYDKNALLTVVHGIFAALGVWFFARIMELEATGTPLVNTQAGVEGLAIIAGLAISQSLSRGPQSRRSFGVYGLAAHVGLLTLTFREFVNLENGHGIITSIWGVYTIGLIILSLRQRDTRLKQVATATLVLVIAKLFFVDLGNLESLWRILLFISLGGLLMAVSYFYQRIWNSSAASNESGQQQKQSET